MTARGFSDAAGGAADRLFLEAMDLWIAQDRDPARDAPQAAAWRAQSPAHQAAWREVLEIDGMAGAVLTVRPQGPSRRSFLFGGLALGGAGLAGAMVLPAALRWLQSDYATVTAEVLPVELPDGSRLTLGPRSTLALDFRPGLRRISLLDGMMTLALRAPLSEAEAPVQLDLPGLSLAARSATVEISADGGELQLALLSGALDGAGPVATLAAGQRLNIAGGARRISPLSPEQFGLWREGELMADDDSVAAMVARVARWQPGKVMITDSTLAAQRVSGLYRLDDPRAALQAIVAPYGGRIRTASPWLTLVTAG